MFYNRFLRFAAAHRLDSRFFFTIRFFFVILIGMQGIASEIADEQNHTVLNIDNDDFVYSEKKGSFQYTTGINVTASRPDDPSSISQLPAFLTVIRIEPETARFRTLPELLGGTVGVTVRDFGGLGKLSTVSIRGSSANQVIVLLDGIRMNTASDSGVDLSTLPMDTLEKIEILRGADSAVFGSGAIGGVINLVSRKDSPAGWSGSGGASYGSWNTANTDWGVWHNSESVRISVTAAMRRTDGNFPFVNDRGTAFNPDDDYRDRRTNNTLESYESAIRFQSALSSNTTVSGNLEGFYADKGIPGLTTFPSEKATQTDRRITTFLRLEYIPSGRETSRFFIEPQAKFMGMDFDDPEGEQTGVPVFTHQRTHFAGIRSGWSTARDNGGAGIALHYDSERLKDDTFGDVSRRSFAVSCRLEHAFFDKALWITGLLRYDDISDAGTHGNPKIGARWFVTDRFSVKSNAGYGFRAPAFNELYLEAGYISGNPDLSPEKALSLDAGVSYEARRWRMEAAWFRIDADDLIQYQLVSGFRYKPFNIGRSRSEGIELDASVNLGAGFNLSGSYTWDRAVDRSGEPNLDGKILPGRPEHDLFLKLSWSTEPLTLWAEGHYLSGNYVTRANTKLLDDRLTGNIGVTWNTANNLQVGIEVKNPGNNRVVDVRGFPLPPRAVFASIRYTF